MRCCGRILLPILGLLLLAVVGAGSAAARDEASILLDYRTGAVLAARNADEPVIPASLTKMMTLYMTFRALTAGQLDLSSRIKVSSRAAGMPPTKLGLRAGDTIRVEDAVLGLVTRSANDAASVLAEALGGSEDRFAIAMTRTARKLGMTRTVFRNASGLPNGEQRSTARDLAKLATSLIRDYPGYYRYFSTASFSYRGRDYANHNRLLGSYRGMDGLKTGYTRASGFNLAASAVRDGRRLVAVVIGGRSAASRDATMVALLDRGFDRAPAAADAAPVVAERKPQPATPAVKEKEIVVASLATTASDAVIAVPSARPERAAKPAKASAKKAKAKAKATKQAAVPAKAKAKAKAAAKAPARAAYGVQVGAFRAAPQARAAMLQAMNSAPDLLRGTFASVGAHKVRSQPLFKATLVGLSRSDAEAACKRLKQKKQDCMVIQAGTVKVASR
jgi:D-alanyl-D-alanine carboxypeptidase